MCELRTTIKFRDQKKVSFFQTDVMTSNSSNHTVAMTGAESPGFTVRGHTSDDAATQSLDELDLTTIQGLRQLQRNFILEEPRYRPIPSPHSLPPLIPSTDCLIDTFPTLLNSATRADKNLEWQLASLDALSIWLLRATRSSNPSSIASKITSSEWESLISLTWIRWASAPNSNAIQKILKEAFSKTLVLQRILYVDWKEREIELLEKVVIMTGIDLKIQCYLIEVLVRRASNGAQRILQIRKDWVMKMLAEMKDGSIGPAVGKCLVSVLMVRRTELMTQDPEVLIPEYFMLMSHRMDIRYG